MVRQESDESVRIKSKFTENSEDKSAICNICKKNFKNSSPFNLKRHLISYHKTVAAELLLLSAPNQTSDLSQKKNQKDSCWY